MDRKVKIPSVYICLERAARTFLVLVWAALVSSVGLASAQGIDECSESKTWETFYRSWFGYQPGVGLPEWVNSSLSESAWVQSIYNSCKEDGFQARYMKLYCRGERKPFELAACFLPSPQPGRVLLSGYSQVNSYRFDLRLLRPPTGPTGNWEMTLATELTRAQKCELCGEPSNCSGATANSYLQPDSPPSSPFGDVRLCSYVEGERCGDAEAQSRHTRCMACCANRNTVLEQNQRKNCDFWKNNGWLFPGRLNADLDYDLIRLAHIITFCINPTFRNHLKSQSILMCNKFTDELKESNVQCSNFCDGRFKDQCPPPPDQAGSLSIAPTGEGQYSIFSKPRGILCEAAGSARCSKDFDSRLAVDVYIATGESTELLEWGDTQRATRNCQTFERTWPQWIRELLVGTFYAAKVHTCRVEFPSSKKVRLAPKFGQQKLTVKKSGTGTGKVTGVDLSLSGLIDCGATCSSIFGRNATVVLAPLADEGSQFVGWSDPLCGTKLLCTITMNTSKEITATFNRIVPPSLTVTKGGNGQGTVTSQPTGINCGTTCTKEFTRGSSVTLTATALPGSNFESWGGACQGKNSCSVTMSGNTSVTANFKSQPKTLSVVVRPQNGGGRVRSIGTFQGLIDCGLTCEVSSSNPNDRIELAASPAVGYVFDGWSGACSGKGQCVVLMTAARAVTADFIEAPKKLTLAKNGTGSGEFSLQPSGTSCGNGCFEYPPDTFVTVSATASYGSVLTSLDPGCSVETAQCRFILTRDTKITATFSGSSSNSELPLTVEKVGLGFGTVSARGINCGGDCTESYPRYTIVELQAQADNGSVFAGWIGSCTGNKQSCRVTMDGTKLVRAQFNKAPDAPPPTSCTREGLNATPTCCTGLSRCPDSFCRTSCPCVSAGLTTTGTCCSGLQRCNNNVCQELCNDTCRLPNTRCPDGRCAMACGSPMR